MSRRDWAAEFARRVRANAPKIAAHYSPAARAIRPAPRVHEATDSALGYRCGGAGDNPPKSDTIADVTCLRCLRHRALSLRADLREVEARIHEVTR